MPAPSREFVTPFAERALFGWTLDDKLAPWPQVDVRQRAPARPAPALPGRPVGLTPPPDRRKVPPVQREDLQRDEGRARVLHELMNHELQAIELIALALLRWPDAPAGFRRGLVATLRDEQRHCAMYRDRLLACGGEVGAHPVSDFFWRTLAPAPTPDAFVAGLSLCFESANLDFCIAWRERFAAAGDTQTADVLQQVYDDEIRHVAHGLVWFGRWHPDDRLAAWRRALPPPLSPARAKGPRFDREGRRRAGFTEAELDQLTVEGGSRGRPPRLLWFDAGVEDRVAGRPRSAMSAAVDADLATLPMFLVGAEDAVVAQPPRPAFLLRLREAGFPVPRFVPVATAAALDERPVRRVEPWGPTPDAPPEVDALEPLLPFDPAWRGLSCKAHSARRAAATFAGRAGVVRDLGACWTTPDTPPHGRWVIKRPLSTSGTGRLRGEGPLTDAAARWLAGALAEDGVVVVQPWYERLLDVSVHVTVGDGVRIDGLTRFRTRGGGSYAAGWVGGWTRGLPSDLARALHRPRPGGSLVALLHEAGEAAGAWAAELGWRGPLSIDAAVVRDGDEVRLHPWLETNARRTLGRVVLALAERVHPRSAAWWQVERWSAARAASLERAPAPAVRDGRLADGTLATTDPLGSRTLLTWLSITP